MSALYIKLLGTGHQEATNKFGSQVFNETLKYGSPSIIRAYLPLRNQLQELEHFSRINPQ